MDTKNKPSKVITYIMSRQWVNDVSDERSSGNKLVVNLQEGWEFKDEPGCNSRGFNDVRSAAIGSSYKRVRNTASASNTTNPVTKKAKPTSAVKKSVSAVATEPKKKQLSMTKDAIRKREARAAKKAAQANS